MKRIGIMTCGGDCAGLNVAIRAVVQSATLKYNWEVIGIKNGTMGLLGDTPNTVPLDLNFQGFNHAMLRMGGTILGSTTKGNPMAYSMNDGSHIDRSEEIFKNYRKLNLDALIAIGGDGGLKITNDLAKKGGINFIGIPKTIDNDVPNTESIGFATAVSVATAALDNLQPTAASHDRVMILEVMGRDAGHIALHSGIAGGADVILIPEIPFNFDSIIQKVKEVQKSDRSYALLVVSEAAFPKNGKARTVKYHSGDERYGGIGDYIGQELNRMMGIDTRVTVLGHVQRGGSPVSRDRIIASAFGVKAVELIAQEKFGRMVGWDSQDKVIDVDITETLKGYQTVNMDGSLITTARGLGISFGNE